VKTCLKDPRFIISALLLSLLPLGSFAAETEHHGRHSLGLFAGITREHKHNRETIGIEYSYRISRYWSAGAVVERAERDKNSTLAIAFVHLWPTEFLYLGVGIGRKDPGEERENVLRGTIGYEFELGKGWAISPQANVDVIENNENEEVYGLVLGKRF
jgi:hypothetical protein